MEIRFIYRTLSVSSSIFPLVASAMKDALLISFVSQIQAVNSGSEILNEDQRAIYK